MPPKKKTIPIKEVIRDMLMITNRQSDKFLIDLVSRKQVKNKSTYQTWKGGISSQMDLSHFPQGSLYKYVLLSLIFILDNVKQDLFLSEMLNKLLKPAVPS